MFPKVMLTLLLALSQSAPATAADETLNKVETLLDTWRNLDKGPTCVAFRKVAGGDVIEVDTSDPGHPEPVFGAASATSRSDKWCKKFLLPMVDEGVFRSNAFCKADGQNVRCTLMTPTSIPRVLTFVAHEGGLWLKRIEWQRKAGRPIPLDDDDDLPM